MGCVANSSLLIIEIYSFQIMFYDNKLSFFSALLNIAYYTLS